MKARAVIFDLYGTLVRETTRKAMFDAVQQMAREVGADPIAFASAWFGHGTHGPQDRALPWIESTFQGMCESLGVELDAHRPRHLTQQRKELIAQTLLPRQGALRTLAKLHARGVRTAVVGDTPADVPAMFNRTELATHVDLKMLSCSDTCGHAEPRVLAAAVRELEVPAEGCVYVTRYSHAGIDAADALGMQTVLLCDDAASPKPDDLPFVTRRFETLLEVFWMAADCEPQALV